ncbi:MAG: orotidine-5'-phosphate decarboxylase [Proteobacteria bacterium]|nr:orotidine-5'-phosphate decarboxylase [Pseudomonadota bacterium]
MSSNPGLAFPLDVGSLTEARQWVARLRSAVDVFKVGLELFTRAGPDAVHVVHDAGASCFLDLKLHDIPATVARGTQAAAAMGVSYLTLHSASGAEALRQAQAAAQHAPTRLLAVGVLTSLDTQDLRAIGVLDDPLALMKRRAELAIGCGVTGFITSPRECALLRELVGPGGLLVTPGIRLGHVDRDDQKRAARPREAVLCGADLLVVGRPLREAADPVGVAATIRNEMDEAYRERETNR